MRPEVVQADLSSQREIRETAEAIRSTHPRIHVLINNAGLIPKQRETTVSA